MIQTGSGEGPSADEVRRGSVRGLVASFGGQGICLAVSAAQIVVVSRLVSPELFGLFGMTWAVLMLLYNIKDFGLSSAVVQNVRGDRPFQDAAFWLSLLCGICMAAAVVLVGPVLAAVYGHREVASICWKLAPLFVIGGMTSHYQAVMRRNLKYVRLNIVNVTAQIVGTGGAIALAASGRGIDALVFQTLGQELTFILLLPFVSGWRPGSFHFRAEAAYFLSFGGNLSVFRIVQNLASTMDHVSLGLFTSPAVVGLYNRAQTLLSTPRRQMVTPMGQVLPTLLARLQHDKEAFARASGNIVSASSLIWYSFLALIVAVPSQVLGIALGGQWAGAARLMQILAFGEMWRLPLTVVNMAETQLGHTGSLRNFGLVSAPLTAGALLFGAWLGGVERGALYMAVAYAILQAGLLALRLFQIRNVTPLTPVRMGKALLGPLIFGICLAVIFRLGAWLSPWRGEVPELGCALFCGILAVGALLLVSVRARRMMGRIVVDVRGAIHHRR